MSRRDDRVSLQDMLDHAREAVRFSAGRTREVLADDRLRQLALTRLVEIIGEAANRVTPEGRQRWPGIPWADIIAMRNRLVHGYDVIDLGLLWHTVTTDLPVLIQALEGALSDDV